MRLVKFKGRYGLTVFLQADAVLAVEELEGAPEQALVYLGDGVVKQVEGSPEQVVAKLEAA